MACKVPFTHSFVQPSIRRFYKVFEKKFVSSSGDLSDRSKVFHSSPRSFYAPFFSILLLMVFFGGSVGMEDMMANLLLIFC